MTRAERRRSLPVCSGVRAVPIEAGAHSVDLVYDPLSFRLGVGLSAAGLVLAALSLVTDRPRWV